MSKKSALKKNGKSGLSDRDRELGKSRLYIIFGMIIVGLAIAIYTTH
jgi:hypothetical protein